MIGWIVMIPAVFVVALILAISFYEGRKAYWDSKVREMCAKDGGALVHERVTLTKAEYDRLGGQEGMIPIPSIRSAAPDYPYVAKTSAVICRENDPHVYKVEDLRQSDRKVLATSVRYFRVRVGDFPTYVHPSSLACPDQKKAVAYEKAISSIEGIPR